VERVFMGWTRSRPAEENCSGLNLSTRSGKSISSIGLTVNLIIEIVCYSSFPAIKIERSPLRPFFN
jgi:hypothetical protein